jgi:hypothetical protein
VSQGSAITGSLTDSRSYCIGVKDGLIKVLAPSFTREEMEGAEVIDAEQVRKGRV